MSIIKNGFFAYFSGLSMAWIVPPNFSLSGFKTFLGILFGITIGTLSLVLLRELNGRWDWETPGELIGTTIGFMAAIVWDKNSLPALLVNKKGITPFNALFQGTESRRSKNK
jgi:hypothetical protein